MSGEAPKGEWIPLVEYAMKQGISVSTLRRRIKSKQIPYRIERGRYLLWSSGRSETQEYQDRIDSLEENLHKAQEEITELKMLIALYEEKIPPSLSP